MITLKKLFIFVLLLFLSVPSIVFPKLPKRQLEFNIVPLCFNPLGISMETQLKRNFSLFNSDNFLFKDNYLSFSLVNSTTPVQTKNGISVVFKPALFFDLEFRYQHILGWKELSFNSLDSNISKEIIKNKRANDKQNGSGHLFFIKPSLYLAMGKIFFINSFTYYYTEMNHSNIFYNSYFDHLQTNGFNWNLDSMLLYKIKNYLIGLNSSTTYVKENSYQKTNFTFMLLAKNIGLASKNDTLIIRIGIWIKDQFRKDEYEGIYGLMYYSFSYDL